MKKIKAANIQEVLASNKPSGKIFTTTVFMFYIFLFLLCRLSLSLLEVLNCKTMVKFSLGIMDVGIGNATNVILIPSNVLFISIGKCFSVSWSESTNLSTS